jgi:hypothetical protein
MTTKSDADTGVKKMLSFADLNATKLCEAEYQFYFIDAQGIDTKWLINVIGAQAQSIKKSVYKRIDGERRAAAMLEKRGKDAIIKPIEDAIFDNVGDVSACIVGWSGLVEEYTPEMARTICENNPLVLQQVKEASENLANFMPSK